MWITARDERVCPQCGPLHGQKVGVNQQFVTSVGQFWTPGLHPNCRCVVRLLENRFSKADWDPREHPRGGDPKNPGRFSRVAERDQPPVINVAEPDVIETTTEEPVNIVGLGRPVNVRPTQGPVNIQGVGRAPVNIQGIGTQKPVNILGTENRKPINIQGVDKPVNIQGVEAKKPVNILGLVANIAPSTPTVEVMPPGPKTRRVPFAHVRGLMESYYKTVEGDPGFHQFDQESFSADRESVLLRAAELREQLINAIMNDHVVDGQVRYPDSGSSYSVPLQARIPEAEFRNILETMAYHTTLPSEHSPKDVLVNIDYYDPDAEEGDAPVETVGRTLGDISHSLGIDPEQLKVNVLRVEDVHSENVGRGTARRVVVVGQPYEEYEITGDYESVDDDVEHEKLPGFPVGIDIHTIYPHDPALGYIEEPVSDWEDLD
jgi:hypothetical protein